MTIFRVPIPSWIPPPLSFSPSLSVSPPSTSFASYYEMYLYIFSVATLVSLHMIDLLLYLLFMDVPRARLLWGPDDFYRFD